MNTPAEQRSTRPAADVRAPLEAETSDGMGRQLRGREIWLVSGLPPPVHGVTVFNAALIDALAARQIPHRVFRVGTRSDLARVGRFELRKLAADGSALARLGEAALRARIAGRRDAVVVYFTPYHEGAVVLRDLAVATLCASLGMHVVAHIHGAGWLESARRGGLRARALCEVIRNCDPLICLGSRLARKMQAATRRPCVAIDNGVEPAPRAAARSLPPPAGRLELLYLSNLIRAKGLWCAAEAVRELCRRGVRARLRCAGSWQREAERADFFATFAPAICEGTIEVVGFAGGSAKDALLDEAHFFLLPTRLPEGQPLALIEAMARGVVPIATSRGGIPDLCDFPGGDALCSPRHATPAGIADTIGGFLASPASYEAASAACLRKQREDLTLQGCVAQILSALEGRRPRP